jgi:LmbE family N-acetylglucosaminyl deacetylase
MTFLFIFAHPDDETVACAGTIHQLVERGCAVHVIHATDGGAGEVTKSAAQSRLEQLASVAALREEEMQAAASHLGLSSYQTLGIPDGTITNGDVWGKLKELLIEQIDQLKPHIVTTFDHTGWYYHLDHVGVSIATTLAYQQAAHRPEALLFSHFRPKGVVSKWKYVFPDNPPISHRVTVTDREHKLQAMQQHASQDLSVPEQFMNQEKVHQEEYQLAFATKVGTQLLKETKIFQPVLKTAK